MEWTRRLTQLNDTLSDLVPIPDSIPKFVNAAGLKPSMVNFNGTAQDIWCSVIDEAKKQKRIDHLIEAVLEKYPKNPYLLSAKDIDEIDYSFGPKILRWAGVDDDTLEKLTIEGFNTLLPINFLAKGVNISRAVAKIEIKKGRKRDVGTGFLFKVEGIEDLFFMTNNHVLKNKSVIERSKVIFDFEEDIDGNTKASKSFLIDSNGPWYTSPVSELDVTICKLTGDNELNDFGFIQLKEINIDKNDFVNIIQHPGGQMKQIALYHNIVTNTTDRLVQYLTDTMKGSSGAPVFNSDWEVVALHHSGAKGKINEPKLQYAKYRNEGILINNIIKFLKEVHE
ncbi:S1 family peptidase [Aureispira anguillae]|uniref:Serine protease n=1 Tax=Aureispira anguillae TaxID=2864201 RepID=A0A916DT86_9BACT|nr:serine protease [Aureispira anguillae]BDS12396.1 serine protease [Aureispira anguillae]